MTLLFKPVNTEQELRNSRNVIQKSFSTVAEDFNLTKENAPTNPAFIEVRHLQKMQEKGTAMLGGFADTVQVGFVAIERKAGHEFWMERLAVLPEYRHKGYGRQIVEYAVNYVAELGGATVLIGIIGSHAVLKSWYRNLGFHELETRQFAHLPFPVCYMKKEINF
jgi:ribosomal protein S18 acetylase RimI-like enzyme